MTTSLYKTNSICRVCGHDGIELLLDFGLISLSGVFVEQGNTVDKAPMELGRCANCGLVQLRHSYSNSALYGETYGYESHLNGSMREHLKRKARVLENKYLKSIDKPIVVDVAANDGTLLSGYSENIYTVGIDPLISNFKDYYPKNSRKIESFFSSEAYFQHEQLHANLLTSLSVLYDIENPKKFAKDVSEILAPEGIWHFEQSYLPLMVNTLSYDTVCHEHLTYLRMQDIKTIVESAGLQILDASLNGINGGSIAVTAIKSEKTIEASPYVNYLLWSEKNDGYDSSEAMQNFVLASQGHKVKLLKLINEYKDRGYEIVGLGASTKGNVLLQWLGLNSNIIKFIGDINSKKFGKECPGSGIPIVSEEEIISNASSKTIALVLPWHFREGIVKNCENLIKADAKLLFPLPNIEIVS